MQTIAITVMLIITSIVIYNLRDNIKMEKLTNLQNDIENLRDKISVYYAKYGDIPAKGVYTNTSHINSISKEVDTGRFLVIDLSELDNLTLNYGTDYETVRNLSGFIDPSANTFTSEQMKNNTNLYIINETSHNIFFVEGIELYGKVYYTDYSDEEKDTVPVELHLSNVL